MNSKKSDDSNSSKFIFLSVILVAILIIFVLCLSFTAFKKVSDNSSRRDSDDINDTSGDNNNNSSISMTYTEKTNGISIQDALPVSDDVGKKLSGTGEYFDFTITSNVVKESIVYEISAIKDKDSTISDNDIKLYLEKQINGTYESVVEPTTFSAIDTKSEIGSPANSMVLFKTTKKKSGTDNYRLRMWIKEDSSVEMDKFYTVKINVYGKAS